jgi:hypothetical protein
MEKEIEIQSNSQETKSPNDSKSKNIFIIHPLNSPRIKSPTTPTSSKIPLGIFF